ncbi:MAG: prephenate dehydratase [Muribaculaceae bacterium]|nr:prephenate dehydratase [Muribaculaceae bacterium]MDE5594087.1 prephenate dehydratase [Muribaculaceae bacterium]MDE6702627.1 prephenate dehydratase [Muribaculaceae bacterium]
MADNTKLKVTIQGVAGCFHDAAAREYFAGREIETVPFDTFHDMFDALEGDASLVGIVAIENTIAGSLLQNHEMLRQSNLRIIGEHKKRISHVLAALPGQTIDSLTEVNSHPMALMQCEQFLRRHPNLKMIEHFDTAGSAKEIAENNLRGHAAVCGDYAAKLYGLEILESGIETNRRNFTRFLIVANPLLASEIGPSEKDINKASIVFTLPHTGGALSKVLTILSFYDMNLSKIQSMPIIGREWEYRFYVDLTFSSIVRYHQAIDAVRPLTNELMTLGEYTDFPNPQQS